MRNPMSINCILTKALGNLSEIDEMHYQILQQFIKSLDRLFKSQLEGDFLFQRCDARHPPLGPTHSPTPRGDATPLDP